LYKVETKSFVFEVVAFVGTNSECKVKIIRYHCNKMRAFFAEVLWVWQTTTKPVRWWQFYLYDFDTVVEKAIDLVNKEAGIVGPIEEKVKEKAEDIRFLEQAVRELDAAS